MISVQCSVTDGSASCRLNTCMARHGTDLFRTAPSLLLCSVIGFGLGNSKYQVQLRSELVSGWLLSVNFIGWWWEIVPPILITSS